MSVSEPNISGKVILKTTLGDIEIELWGKETPLTTRNFVQLCLEGYYDGCIFHRVIKDFIAQTGDPTNTGTGGESIYQEKEIQDNDTGDNIKSTGFKDEFHSRLRFNRRGMVGMASSSPDQNKSQFFFSLAKTENLTKKHTVFGRVAGDTLFNLLKVNDLEVDPETDIPLFPPKIISTDVVWNPFPDITPRVKTIVKKKVEKKKQTKKNLNLLSFGDEEENEGEFDNSKLIHNNINVNNDNNIKLNNKNNNNNSNNILKEIKNSGSNSGVDSGYNLNDGDNYKEQIKKNNPEIMREAPIENKKKGEDVGELKNVKNELDSSTLPKSNTTISATSTTTTTTTTTHPPLKEQVKKSVDKKKKIKGSLQFKTTSTSIVPKKSRSISETDLLNKLNSFKNTLNSKPSNIKRSVEKEEDEEENDDDWMGHSLKFSKKSKLEYE
ncbi:hypothetical protein ACTFIV_001351 [Dictyostelium citrinum]